MNKKEEERKKKIYEEALKVALDNRKFEIELYWRRTKYFFDAFIALGGFTLLIALLGLYDKIEGTLMYTFLIMLECVGLVSAFAWVCANRGSKYWQVNWEQYVDELGKEILGPLFKYPIDPKANKQARYSVSRVNLTLSWYVLCVWIAILLLTLVACCISSGCALCKDWSTSCGLVVFSILLIVGSAVTIYFLGCRCIGRKKQKQEQIDEEIAEYSRDVDKIAENLVKKEESEKPEV